MHCPGDNEGYPDTHCLEQMSFNKLAQAREEKRKQGWNPVCSAIVHRTYLL